MKCITDEYFSFGLKIRILEKLSFESYKGFLEDIRRTNKIRNIIAYCSPGALDGSLIFYNQNKKIHEIKKLEELHKEFLEKIQKVEKQLRRILNLLIKENESKN